MDSHGRYGDSPFLYPVYGLGGIPEGFSRMCAIHGGTFMLNTDIDEILFEDGKVVGVRNGDVGEKLMHERIDSAIWEYCFVISHEMEE